MFVRELDLGNFFFFVAINTERRRRRKWLFSRMCDANRGLQDSIYNLHSLVVRIPVRIRAPFLFFFFARIR